MIQEVPRSPTKSPSLPIGRFRAFPLLSPKAILSPGLAKAAVPQLTTASLSLKPTHARIKSMQVFAPAVLGGRHESRQTPARSQHSRHLSYNESPPAHILLGTVSHQTLRGSLCGTLKSYNQDTVVVLPSFQDDPTAYFLAVGDGHGSEGHKVSKYVAMQLPKRLREIRSSASQVKALPEILRGMQRDVCSSDKFEAAFSGSTLVAVVFAAGSLLVINVGDSRAVLVSKREGRVQTTALTTDHKPTLPGESDRILSHMGRIEPCFDSTGQPSGPLRVWLQDEDLPGLAMSRSLGDSIAHQAGVVETPEVCVRQVQRSDVAIVLASDGVWDVLTNEEVGALIDVAQQRGEERECSLTLAKTAESRWKERGNSMDDVSVIVGFFHVI